MKNPEVNKNNKSMRCEKGPCKKHTDCVASTGKKTTGNTTITYFESDAKSPPDILCVGGKKYTIVPGLKIVVPHNTTHSVISTDPNSKRIFTAKDDNDEDVHMDTIQALIPSGTLIYKVNNKYMDSNKDPPMLIINGDNSFNVDIKTEVDESTNTTDFIELPNKSKDDYNGLWLGNGGLYNLLDNDFTTTKLQERIIQKKPEKISYTRCTVQWTVNEELLNQSKTDGFSLHHLDVNNTKLDYNSDLLDELYMTKLDIKSDHSPEKETFADFEIRQTNFRTWFNNELKDKKKMIENTEINYADKEIEIIDWGDVPLSKKGGLFKYFNGKLPINESQPQILENTNFDELFMHSRNSSNPEEKRTISSSDQYLFKKIDYINYTINDISDNEDYTYEEFLTLLMNGDMFYTMDDSGIENYIADNTSRLISIANQIHKLFNDPSSTQTLQEKYSSKIYNEYITEFSTYRNNINKILAMYTEDNIKGLFNLFPAPKSDTDNTIDHFKNIEKWDTSGVISMRKTFSRAFNFNSDITQWNTSNVTTMEEMFCFCEKFNQPIETTDNSWNVSKVKNMSGMFNGALNFNQPIGGWDVGDVEGKYNTTRHENLIKELTISPSEKLQIWENESDNKYRVTNDGEYTTGARKHKRQQHYKKHYPTKTWQEGAKKQHQILEGGMSYMFYGARDFNQDLSNWDVKNVRDMSYMFYNATEFNNGDNVSGIGNWFNKEINYKIEDMSYMFAASEEEPTVLEISDNASNISLKRPSYPPTNKFSGDISEWFPLESSNEVNNIRKIFCNCEFFKTDISGWHLPAINVKVTKLRGTKDDDKSYRTWEDKSQGTYWTYRYRDSVDIGLEEYLTTKNKHPDWFLLSPDSNTGGIRSDSDEIKQNGADEAEWTVLHPHSSLADVYKNTLFFEDNIKKLIPTIISAEQNLGDEIENEFEYFQSISMWVINDDGTDDWWDAISATPTYDFFNPGFGLE